MNKKEKRAQKEKQEKQERIKKIASEILTKINNQDHMNIFAMVGEIKKVKKISSVDKLGIYKIKIAMTYKNNPTQEFDIYTKIQDMEKKHKEMIKSKTQIKEMWGTIIKNQKTGENMIIIHKIIEPCVQLQSNEVTIQGHMAEIKEQEKKDTYTVGIIVKTDYGSLQKIEVETKDLKKLQELEDNQNDLIRIRGKIENNTITARKIINKQEIENKIKETKQKYANKQTEKETLIKKAKVTI